MSFTHSRDTGSPVGPRFRGPARRRAQPSGSQGQPARAHPRHRLATDAKLCPAQQRQDDSLARHRFAGETKISGSSWPPPNLTSPRITHLKDWTAFRTRSGLLFTVKPRRGGTVAQLALTWDGAVSAPKLGHKPWGNELGHLSDVLKPQHYQDVHGRDQGARPAPAQPAAVCECTHIRR